MEEYYCQLVGFRSFKIDFYLPFKVKPYYNYDFFSNSRKL